MTGNTYGRSSDSEGSRAVQNQTTSFCSKLEFGKVATFPRRHWVVLETVFIARQTARREVHRLHGFVASNGSAVITLCKAYPAVSGFQSPRSAEMCRSDAYRLRK